MTLDLLFEILGTVVGLFYLYYEYKANPLVWIAGIIMPALSLIVYYNAGLYADFGINIYYLVAAVYGYIFWNFKGQSRRTEELPVTRMPLRYYPLSVLLLILVFAAISYVLIRFTDSNVPLCDSFTTALSVIGMWMLARKYLEQWIAWIVVDVVSAGLYVYKEIYFYAALYAIYAIIAIFGYYNWKKLMLNEKYKSV